MMKISAGILLLSASASAKPTNKALPTEVTAGSDLGRSLLSKARRLDENNDDEVDMTWIAGYSLKFQGCRHHTQMGDDDDEVSVKTVRLAHFRLCPSDSCTSWLGGGCKSGYGDYVVELETFAQAFIEGQKRALESQCEMYMYENCDCQDSDDKGDDFDKDYCEYDCYNDSKNFQNCIDRNPYEEEEEGEREEEFEAERYVECQELEVQNDDDGNNGDDGEDVSYYIGPYCSEKGGDVYLGVFTEETCTTFADDTNGRTTYSTLTGTQLPYSTGSLLTSDCISCIEQQNPNSSNDGDDDGVQLNDKCEELYESAGKCESGLAGKTSEANNNACSYINGIQFTRVNGVVDKALAGSSTTATVFIVLFAGAFAGLAFFAVGLRKKLVAATSAPPLLEKDDNGALA